MITKKFREINHRKENRKYRGGHFYIKGHFAAVKIFEEFFDDCQKALDILAQFYIGKCNEVVELYKYEKDSRLSLVNNRDVLFMKNKCKVVKTYFNLGDKINSPVAYEKAKFLNKKAAQLIFMVDKGKDYRLEKICTGYLRLYEITLSFIIKYLKKNVDKIDKNRLLPKTPAAPVKPTANQQGKNPQAGEESENEQTKGMAIEEEKFEKPPSKQRGAA